MNLFNQIRRRPGELGQTIPFLALMIIVLLMFMGLAIDLGFGYITKANLSKGVDAAALIGIQNYGLGAAAAQNIAVNAFNANYLQSGRDNSAPVINAVLGKDGVNDPQMTVTATATINTFFMPGWKTFSVSATSVAIRNPVIMSLVLDRSGSMTTNGGAAALPQAVTDFVNLFSGTLDQVEMITFGSTAVESNANGSSFVAMGTNFNGASGTITNGPNGVNHINFNGHTFSVGGLYLALQDETNAGPVVQGQQPQKVVVFFTDGWANTIEACTPGYCPPWLTQQTFPECTGSATTSPDGINFGGIDANPPSVQNGPPTEVDYWDGTNGNGYGGCGVLANNGVVQNCGGTFSCPANPPPTFTTAQFGNQEAFIRYNVTQDAQWQAVQQANQMRNQGMYVYAIGLGGVINPTFLYQIANDCVNGPQNGVPCNPNLPQGETQFVPDCPVGTGDSGGGSQQQSAQCSAELDAAFQYIAQRILFRLTN